MHAKCRLIIACGLFFAGICQAYDWSVGVENVFNWSELTVSYEPNEGFADGIPADARKDLWFNKVDENASEWFDETNQRWGAALSGTGDPNLDQNWVGHDEPWLAQRNSEDVDVNPLTFSITVPMGHYQITMYDVYLHGAPDGGGGDLHIAASAEGISISFNEGNGGVAITRDVNLAPIDEPIEVNDGQLDITVGNCYTNNNSMGNWFSFEGFKITQVNEPPPPPTPDQLLPARPADVSRGHWIILHKGFNIHALVYQPHALDMNRFEESNFTGVNTYQNNNPQYFGAPPGIPWSRNVWFGFLETLADKEIPYALNLHSLGWGDEQDVASDPHKTWTADWMERTRQLYPEVILHTTQWGTQLGLDGLQTYMAAAEPDMLMFDQYSYGSTSYAGYWSGYYAVLEKYRQAASMGNDWTGTEPIPWAIWLHGYLSVSGPYIPSESFVRHHQNSCWTFGAKYAALWFYNRSNSWQSDGMDSILFYNGDYNQPTPTFYYMAETNRQSRNLGPTLIRLQSTDTYIIPGQHMPISVDEYPYDNKWGEANDGWVGHPGPYLVQRNGENVDSNPLTLSLSVPNDVYEITMNNVFMHGAQQGGGGNYLVTASAEGIDISDNASNGGVGTTIDIPLATDNRRQCNHRLRWPTRYRARQLLYLHRLFGQLVLIRRL